MSVPLSRALGPAFTAVFGASSCAAFCPINLRDGLVHHPTKRAVACDDQPTGTSSRMPAPVHRVGVSDHPVYAARLYSVAQAQSAGSHLVAALVSATLGPNYSIKGNHNRADSGPLISGVRPVYSLRSFATDQAIRNASSWHVAASGQNVPGEIIQPCCRPALSADFDTLATPPYFHRIISQGLGRCMGLA